MDSIFRRIKLRLIIIYVFFLPFADLFSLISLRTLIERCVYGLILSMYVFLVLRVSMCLCVRVRYVGVEWEGGVARAVASARGITWHCARCPPPASLIPPGDLLPSPVPAVAVCATSLSVSPRCLFQQVAQSRRL